MADIKVLPKRDTKLVDAANAAISALLDHAAEKGGFVRACVATGDDEDGFDIEYFDLNPPAGVSFQVYVPEGS
jgi:hypothetical protein